MEMDVAAGTPASLALWPAASPLPGCGPRVLIVGGSGQEVRQLRTRIRRTAPEIEVSLATSAGRAVSRLLARSPDVALIGQTRDLGSAELVRVLRAIQPTVGVVIWNPFDIQMLATGLDAEQAPLVIARTVGDDRLLGAIQRAYQIRRMLAPVTAAMTGHPQADPKPARAVGGGSPAVVSAGEGSMALAEAAQCVAAVQAQTGNSCDPHDVLLLTDSRWLETVEHQLRTTLGGLERTSREQALSLAAVSHDVRGALSSIAGFAELLRDQPPADDAARLASQIALLAHRTSEMMVELIEYARVRQPSAASGRAAVFAREVVAECGRSAELQCAQKGLAFHLDLPSEGVVMTDRLQLIRVIQNLLNNAIRYTPHGGVRLAAELTPTTLSVTVSDTGVGIAPADLESVFSEFYRTEQAKRMDRLGTGLGLATVKRLCALLGATVDVYSEPGVGSTFRIVIPRFVCGQEALTPRAA